jgi:pimeloyl-ACP methyl ester carboxylesterase
MLKSLPVSLIAGALLVASLPAMAEPPAPPAAAATPAKSIILVHGAFADGSSWSKVIPALQAKGFNVVAVQNPLSSLADDVAATKRAIEAAPGPVILVGHSWGGVVITEAGNNDKVAGLVYVAAFAPDAGESVNDLGKGKPAPSWLATLKVDSGGFAWLPAETVAKDFAQDVSAADAKLIAVTQGPVATKAFDDKVKTAAWKTKPSWYIVADQDHMIDPQGQAAMAKRAGATTTTLKGSHVIMVSKPKEVAAVILTAAAGKPKK